MLATMYTTTREMTLLHRLVARPPKEEKNTVTVFRACTQYSGMNSRPMS